MSKTYLKAVFEKSATISDCVKLVEALQESALVKNVEVYMEVDDKRCLKNIECLFPEISYELIN
jgi:hypothetical protein